MRRGSRRDSCNAECGVVFEPFCEPAALDAGREAGSDFSPARVVAGDQCGGMLTNAGMGGMEEMSTFYDHCLESLYPPGMCVSGARASSRCSGNPEVKSMCLCAGEVLQPAHL